MIRKLLITAVAFGVLMATPAAAQYPEVVVTPGKVTPGGTVTVTGKGCAPGSEVIITIRKAATGQSSVPLGGVAEGRLARPAAPVRPLQADAGAVVSTTTADQNGNFTVSFKVPKGYKPGWYEVTAECTDVDGNTLSRTQLIEVVAADVPAAPGGNGGSGAGSGDLPRTGSNLNGIGLLGAGLLVAGGLFLLTAQKRRRSATPA